MKKSKTLFNLIFLLVSLFAVLYLILKFEQLDNVVSAFKSLNPIYIVICIVAMIFSWLIESYILYDISDGQLTYKHSVYIVVAGLFFNAITPFSTGGQPMQLYMMHKYKISVGRGGSILTRKFLVYQTVMVLYGLAVVLFQASYFISRVESFMYFGLIGFAVNLIVIIGLYFVAFKYRATRKFAICVTKKIRKLTKSKKIRRGCTKFMQGMREFYQQMKDSLNRTNWYKLGFWTFMQLTLLYAVPVFIAIGLDLTHVQFVRMIAASAFVSMVTAFIPLPGAAFGAEGGFYVFFELFFPNNQVLMALILWRLITFYLPLIAGFFVVLYLKYSGMGIRLEKPEPPEDDD